MGASLLSLPSATYTGDGVEVLGSTSNFMYVAVDVDLTAISGTSPTLTLFIERPGPDGNWDAIWSPTALTAVGGASTDIGPGCTTPAVITSLLRLRWVLAGTTPSVTFSASVVGRP